MGCTAIIVDSDKNYRKSLASIIRSHFKFEEIYSCTTAREAIGVARQVQQINLFFCDSNISDQSVLKFVKELKDIESASNAQFILLSNNSSREFLLEAASCGVNAFLLKPFTTKTVTQNIRKLIDGKTQRKTKRIKLFNTVSCAVAFKGAKYKGEIDDLSKGGCMIRLPPLSEGGTIFDRCAIRISYDGESVDLTGELIRLERELSGESKMVNAAFIFHKMQEDMIPKFEKIWNALDKSQSEIGQDNDDEDGSVAA